MAQSQEVPKRKEEKEGWTFKRLFPMSATVSTLTKTFSNPFDVLLGYLVAVIGIVELLGRHVSWTMWVFSSFILLAALYERHKVVLPLPKKEEKIKT